MSNEPNQKQAAVHWVLTPEQANYILNIMAERPIKEARELFELLVNQSNPPKPKPVVEDQEAA